VQFCVYKMSLLVVTCFIVIVLATTSGNAGRVNDGVIIDQISERLGEMMKSMDDNFKQMDDKFKKMDDKFKKMDDKFKQMDDKFKQIDAKLRRVDDNLDNKFQHLDKKLEELKKGQYLLSGYWGIPGQVLKLHMEKKTWNDARRTCQQFGGDLVIVKDPLINQWLAMQHSKNKVGGIWIGASDQAKEGTWIWTDGSSVNSPYWSGGQPDDYGIGQDCAYVNFVSPGKWDDGNCGATFPFVCQFFY